MLISLPKCHFNAVLHTDEMEHKVCLLMLNTGL